MFCKRHHHILPLKQEETEELQQDALVKSGHRFCLVLGGFGGGGWFFFGGACLFGLGFLFEGIGSCRFQGRSMLGSNPEIVSSVP